MESGKTLSTVVEALIDDLRPPITGCSPGDYGELASSCLWLVDLSWSNEAQKLRKVAIQCPDKLTVVSARDMIAHLKITDKQVTHVDSGMLQFHSLKELTLTGNYVTAVDCCNLPPSMQVLEMCYNNLTELPLVGQSPLTQLLHLGVAFNSISSVQLTPSHWPKLTSLDLSHNYLSNLEATVVALHGLEALKSVTLTGNPITLVQSYRKFVVDSLSQLLCLDDNDVTSKDREIAEGSRETCQRQKDLITMCKLTIDISEINGLPNLQEEGSESENEMIRHVLVVAHTFLTQGEHFKQCGSGKAEEIMGLCLKQSSEVQAEHDVSTRSWSTVYLEPSIYRNIPSVCAEMKCTYCISQLRNFTQLLGEGIELCLYVNKVVYRKKNVKEGESPSVGKRQLTSAKGSKSGRTTAQSGRSSASKKSTDKKSTAPSDKKTTVPSDKKPVKGKSGQETNIKLPEEDWVASEVTSYQLGSCTIDLKSLLEGKKSVKAVSPVISTMDDKTILYESGLITRLTETDNSDDSKEELEDIKLTAKFTIEEL